ncbi:MULTISPECIES: ketosynthase chain-length factor [unclassified Amycolatopsis]|uniref:ketosynthase chain-length factor n=1 Tax=unclassified Amycolatopsis TaxID=2618356 RepID=UPI00106F02AE|nr:MULTISPECIES: ketosynthase chain-length factor [unclassified Amycolatopsis]
MNAVITGLGVLAPTGSGVKQFWEATLEGASGIGPVTRFDASSYPSTLAGEVAGFSAKGILPSRLLPQTDHSTRMSLVGAEWALADAGVDPEAHDGFDLAVITASSAGGYEFGQRELQNMWSKGGKYVSAYQSFAWFYAVNTGQISIRHGMRGPGAVVVSEQAGGLDAIGKARRAVRSGTAVALTGGIDSALCPWGWAAMLTSGRLSTSSEPAKAYLPFDRSAAGYVPGEGGAVLVLEPADSARDRQPPYAEIAGYASTFDPKPGSGRPPGLRRAIELALTDAGISAAEVDVVFADAAGDLALDREEAEAISALFGARGVPVTAPKAGVGRLAAGGAGLDVACAALAIRHGVVPPTPNVSDPVPEHGIDLVTGAARETPVRAAVVLARGIGGHNAALVLRGV